MLFAPDSATAHGGLCAALFKLENYKQAAESCRRRVELEPDSSPARLNLGRSLRMQGRCNEALEQYKKHESLGSPLATSLFKMIYGDKILSARR